MIDFTSALYLGMHHEQHTLESWPQFTTGKPAALEEPEGAEALGQAIAQLQGLEAGALGSSTLHLAWDLFVILAHKYPIEVFMDAGIYPIARWGVERFAARGGRVHVFAHHNPAALDTAMDRCRRRRRQPVVVADGFCPACGRLAPLRAYLAAVEQRDGWLVVDDTQALAILGQRPDAAQPYGEGGGGTLPVSNLRSSRLLTFSSLAKGFGVPAAVLAGNEEIVSGYLQSSETRTHCSPPALATVRAGRHALAVNQRSGRQLRAHLLDRVRRFRARLADIGLHAVGGLFPVQGLATDRSIDTVQLHQTLAGAGIRALLQRLSQPPGSRVVFLITTRHSLGEIDQAGDAIAAALENQRPTSRAKRPGDSLFSSKPFWLFPPPSPNCSAKRTTTFNQVLEQDL